MKLNQIFRVTILFIFFVVIPILSLRGLGVFQPINFRLYDWFLKIKGLHQRIDDQIVIIGITENDLLPNNLKEWPIPDKKLARILQAILLYNPEVIGIDLFRENSNSSVKKELDEFSSLLDKNSNIVVINKVKDFAGFGVEAPNILSERPDQVGFSDFPIDDQIDNRIRRGLLFLDDGENVYTSFGLQIALKFLDSLGISMEAGKTHPEHLKLGEETFIPLEPDDGAYITMDARGYQILLNFSGAKVFPTYSISEVLGNTLDEKIFKGKIVLIGSLASSLKDYHRTPVSDQHSGVEIHASIIRQILDSSFGQSNSLQFLREWQEITWIVIWAVVSAILGFGIRSPLLFFSALVLGAIATVSAAGGAFLFGYWIPVAGSFFTLLIGACFIMINIHYIRLKDSAAKLKISNAKLEDSNRNLEVNVAQRTEELNKKNRDLESTISQLKRTQDQLIIQEKLASLGTLTAGIAHELKNPLNFVNNFAKLSLSLTAELKNEMKSFPLAQGQDQKTEMECICNDLALNCKKISEHGERADRIIHSMLGHSRKKAGTAELSRIHPLLDHYITLAQHSFRSNNFNYQVTIRKDYDPNIKSIAVFPQELGRVLLNLFNNAFYATQKKGNVVGKNFAPEIQVSTKRFPKSIEIRIRDNGDGISKEVKENIFTPFFTTKPPGDGTGLGLSISYEIITKLHQGSLTAHSKFREYCEFVISLPGKS